MAVFNLGGTDVHVNAWQTPWPLSVVYKQQGIEVTVNPERHWWCLWLCQTTDDVDVIDCAADLISTFATNSESRASARTAGTSSCDLQPRLAFPLHGSTTVPTSPAGSHSTARVLSLRAACFTRQDGVSRWPAAVGGSLLGHIGGADHTASHAAHPRIDHHRSEHCAVR